MIYLTPGQVLFIHARLIAETGGSHGVRDLGMLKSALGRPQATFDGRELYPDLFTKAAALADSLINNHPFLDGNKRTGITATGLFLRMNGWKLNVPSTKLEMVTLRVATKEIKIAELAAWLQGNAQQESQK